MIFRTPISTDEVTQRNALLQASLRPEKPIFPIADEYPIVLSDAQRHGSICCFEGKELVAHANLWPRRLVDSNGVAHGNIGLVGNVATRNDLRGRGIMKSLFDEIHQSAVAQGLDALILWSDLTEFYQKLGFFALSDELRWGFKQGPQRQLVGDFAIIDASLISSQTLETAYRLRLPVAYTIERSQIEFRSMLSIPATFFAVLTLGSQMVAYAVVGKGYDMVGVVHEWGAASPLWISRLLDHIANEFELPNMLVLTPITLPAAFDLELRHAGFNCDRHSMALAKTLNPQLGPKLKELFIWGLDSI